MHPSTDLTLDHVIPLVAGGELLDERNVQVLCRTCNDTKGGMVQG